jgi:hypothetical protein
MVNKKCNKIMRLNNNPFIAKEKFSDILSINE